LFAARLIQARQLRGLSQRALGDRMGLGKEKGSSRINRYEHQVTAIGFDNLGVLAQVLDVPVAYLLADDATMADAILALSALDEAQRAPLTALIKAVTENPAVLQTLMALLPLSEPDQRKAMQALAGGD
jgi:transcriptional regulator with XRE-family HTH domain